MIPADARVVTPAVHLHDQMMVRQSEVGVVRADRSLTDVANIDRIEERRKPIFERTGPELPLLTSAGALDLPLPRIDGATSRGMRRTDDRRMREVP